MLALVKVWANELVKIFAISENIFKALIMLNNLSAGYLIAKILLMWQLFVAKNRCLKMSFHFEKSV